MKKKDSLERYETFRTAVFPKKTISKIMSESVDQAVFGQNSVIVMNGLVKIHLCQLLEIAYELKHEIGDKGPLQPQHVRAATQILSQQSMSNQFNTLEKLK